ncbi:MAG: glutathione S-transferase family protein [Gaiellaceae bacterium]
MRVYRIPFSTNVERVALALGHKGLAVDWVDVDPADRSPVRRVSGQDLVPVLEDGDEVVVDSMAIVRLLDERFPDLPLYPEDPARRAWVLIFVDWFNRVWKRPPNEIEAELGRPEPNRARIDELSLEMRESLDLFEGLLTGRDYLVGHFSAADCAAFPFLKYALLHDPDDSELFHDILVRHLAFEEERYPKLAAWIRRVDEHPRA